MRRGAQQSWQSGSLCSLPNKCCCHSKCFIFSTFCLFFICKTRSSENCFFGFHTIFFPWLFILALNVCFWIKPDMGRLEEKGEGGAHKRSPPALHLTLSLTLENNRKATSESSHETRVRTDHMSRHARARAPSEAPCVRPASSTYPRFRASFFSHCWRCLSAFDPAQARRCLLQLCAKPNSSWPQLKAAPVFLGARGANAFGTLWETSALYPCELSATGSPGTGRICRTRFTEEVLIWIMNAV